MNIEKKVKETIKKYNLIGKKDKIIVALSGGKDSGVILCILKKLGYNIEGVHVNLGMGKYSEDCMNVVEKLCKKLGIALHVYYAEKEIKKKITAIMKKNPNLSSCTICGVFKKWILNKKSRELKADKIVTGHHLDDELQTFFMNVLKGAPQLSVNFGPILKFKDKKFVVKIKPLFFIEEKEIDEYAKKNKIGVVEEICPHRKETYRIEVRKFFKEISLKQKKNMLRNFVELSKKINKTKNTKISYCGICGEPSRNKICKKCRLMQI